MAEIWGIVSGPLKTQVSFNIFWKRRRIITKRNSGAPAVLSALIEKKMDEIEIILTTGKSSKDDTRQSPTASEIAECERVLNWRLPESYKRFLELDGLAELRLNNAVLSPSEISLRITDLPDNDHVAFADNHCGDLYCWNRSDSESVMFFDHETGGYKECDKNFIEWLKRNKF